MKNKLKKIGIWTGSIVLSLYVLFLASPLVVTPILSGYSSKISEIIKTSTGYSSEIQGLSFITSWNLSAGIKAKKFVLATNDINSPFLNVEKFGVKLSLPSLLGLKIRLSDVFAKNIEGDIIVKKDGSLLILDYLKTSDDTQKSSFTLPLGLKLSNHLPNVNVKSYKLAFTDAISSKKYYVKGENLKISDFILDKKVKVSTTGQIVFDENVISNYDLKIFNKIMPELSLNDIVFPQQTILDEEDTTSTATSNFQINPIEIFNKILENKFSADVKTDVKISGTIKSPKIIGKLNVDAFSVAVDGKILPESYINLKFKEHKTDIDSIFFTSTDENEKTQIIGNVKTGKKPSIDMTLRSNAKLNNIIRLIDSIAYSFGINDFRTLKATGSIDADFNINSDLKKVLSTGYLKINPSSITYGLYNVAITNITANVDLENNNITIKNAGFSILSHALNLVGTIASDGKTNLKLTANQLSIKGLIAALGQKSILKENDISSGEVSLNATIKGYLNAIKPEVNSTIQGVNIYNKSSQVKLTLQKALVKFLYDGKNASGDVSISSLNMIHPSGSVSVPQANIVADETDINIKNTYAMLNNSKINISGSVKNYLNDKMNINLLAKGNLTSSDVVKFLPKEFVSLITYKGSLPLEVAITGNSKLQNIAMNLAADKNNYVSLADIDALKNQNVKLHSNIEIIGDSLTLSNTGISTDKASIASVTGGVSKLYSNPKLNLNISVPNEVSFPIWGVPTSNVTGNCSVAVSGTLDKPQMRGTVNVVDLSIKNMDFAIKDLVADLSGTILNGSATAKSFNVGGIVASDLSGNFSLKDYSKFYLTNLSGKAFDGKIKGDVSYDINSTKTGVEISGSGLNSTNAIYGAVGIKNAITGTLDFNAKIITQGLTDTEMINSMKGDVDFNVTDGRFVSIGRLENLVAAQNVSSNSILKSAVSALSSVSTVQESDKFKYIKGELSLASGSAKLSKILVSGPLMAYYVSGTYNILPNTANLVILGRLEAKVVSCLGVLGELSADKLLAYIPKFGSLTSNILKQLTSDPASENVSLIPDLSGGSTTYKDFKVIFNGAVESSSSVKSFKWLSTCDTSKLDVKSELNNAADAVKTNVTTQVENTKTTVQNVKTNVTNAVQTTKSNVETVKNNVQQAKTDIQTAKDNVKQTTQNVKSLLQNVVKNSQTKTNATTETTTTTEE
jgi:hypothetical protein